MKKFGSVLEFSKERKAEIMRAYRQMAQQCKVINIVDVSHEIAKRPTSRFWVSEERACTVVSMLDRGVPVLDAMRPTKRRMFEEIYRRVKAERREQPDITLVGAVASVIYNPAPEYYLTPKSIKELIYLELSKKAG